MECQYREIILLATQLQEAEHEMAEGEDVQARNTPENEAQKETSLDLSADEFPPLPSQAKISVSSASQRETVRDSKASQSQGRPMF